MRDNVRVTDINIDDFVQLETAVWNALVNGDQTVDAQLLSKDFLGVYPTGFADRDQHAEQLVDGPTVAAFELTEPRTLSISDDVVMLSYRAVYSRVGRAGSHDRETHDQETMYVSSLWCRRSNGWVNVFSQDTPAAKPPDAGVD